MSDKEFLELAANAAGIKIKHWIGNTPHSPEWNPLVDDGDAFRLMVGLRITPHIDCNMTEAEWANQDNGGFVGEPHFNDPLAATRRAIVRAAAEIGKGMK